MTEQVRVKTSAVPEEHSSEQYRLAMDAGRLGLFALHLDTNIIHCSAQCLANLGLHAGSPYNFDTLLHIIEPEDRAGVKDALDRAVSTGSDFRVLYRAKPPGAKPRWIEANGRVTYGLDKAPNQIVGVTRDVSDQLETLGALRVSEATLQEHEHHIRALYELTSRTDIGFREKVDGLLEAGRRWLTLDTAVLAQIDCAAGSYRVEQIDSSELEIDPGFTCSLYDTFCSETVMEGADGLPVSVQHAGADPHWQAHRAYSTFGSEAYIAAVVRAGGTIWGTLAFASKSPRESPFSDFECDLVRLMAQWIAGEIARQQAVAALGANAARQRRFIREMLMSVTDGKLCLCDDARDLPERLPLAMPDVDLKPEALAIIRSNVRAVAGALNYPTDRIQDLVTAASEAAMNAVKHGGGGVGSLHADRDKHLIQVWIVDHGKGIREEDLHRATLEKGWSGSGSLGHGFFLMLQTVDRTFLLTSTEGTVVVLEQEWSPPQPRWLQKAGSPDG